MVCAPSFGVLYARCHPSPPSFRSSSITLTFAVAGMPTLVQLMVCTDPVSHITPFAGVLMVIEGDSLVGTEGTMLNGASLLSDTTRVPESFELTITDMEFFVASSVVPKFRAKDSTKSAGIDHA